MLWIGVLCLAKLHLMSLQVDGKECFFLHTKTYIGSEARTQNSLDCHYWTDEEVMDAYGYDKDLFSRDGSIAEAHNYCRDPSGSGEFFCFTNHPIYEPTLCENIDLCELNDPFLVKIEGDLWVCREVEVIDFCDTHEVQACADIAGIFSLEHSENCSFEVCCMERGCTHRRAGPYNGTWSYAEDKRPCLNWTNLPEEMDLTGIEPLIYEQNYCQDVFNDGVPSCFVEGSTTLQSCGIPDCSRGEMWVGPDFKTDHVSYNHSCYNITERDLVHPALPSDPSERDLCELEPYRFYIDNHTFEYPGCMACSCCQTKPCWTGPSWEYRGSWSMARDGEKCHAWNNSEYLEEPGDSYNYCRDFSRDGVAGCFLDSEHLVYGFCDLDSYCPNETTHAASLPTSSSYMTTTEMARSTIGTSGAVHHFFQIQSGISLLVMMMTIFH